MSVLSLPTMRSYLSKSISSLNANKLNGLLAEVDFRRHITELGFGDRISPGGWIARREGPGEFGHHTVVFFPELITPGADYSHTRAMPLPSVGLHTICATFHQTGISSYFCAASIGEDDDASSVRWQATQLGLPQASPFEPFPSVLVENFRSRARRHNFLRYDAPAASIPDNAVPEEFSKECLRIAFQDKFMAQVSDVDGIFWGRQFTYPLEIKEKTAAVDKGLGPYFGLDLGPFVKLSYYAAKRGNLHSLFIVKEIDNVETRGLVAWWYITFDKLAQYASWVPRGGGQSMTGGQSSVVQIPRCEFSILDANSLELL